MVSLSMINDSTSQTTVKMMELSELRQRIISNNLANANTPNYIRKDMSFKDELAQVLNSGQTSDIASVQGQMYEDYQNPTRTDGNNVVIASEMNEMMQNGMLFNLLTRTMTTRLNILRTATKGV